MADSPRGVLPGDYERALQLAYESFLVPGDVAIDVGAHRGRHTLPIARRVLPGGRVLAFEPLPSIRSELVDTLKFELPDAGEAVQVFPYALGERAAKTEFVVARDAPEYSGLRERVYGVPTALERIPIEVRVLDELTSSLTRLRYVKIDAEGGEYHILSGARGMLRRLRPIVTFEFGQESFAGYGITAADMNRLLEELGYRTFDIRGRDVSEREVFVESATRQEVWDYVAMPADQVPLFQERIRPLLERFLGAPLAAGPLDTRSCRSRMEVVSPDGPLTIPQEKTERIRVRVTNAGATTWGRGSPPGTEGVILGFHWHHPSAPERLGEGRAELPLPMAPGAGEAVTVSLRPVGYGGQPLPRGTYEVWLGPLVEGVAWFSDQGDPLLRLPVTVA